MTPDNSSRPYEVERDRFGTYYSGPLEVGECIEVVRVDALLDEGAVAMAEGRGYEPHHGSYEAAIAIAREELRRALNAVR